MLLIIVNKCLQGIKTLLPEVDAVFRIIDYNRFFICLRFLRDIIIAGVQIFEFVFSVLES